MKTSEIRQSFIEYFLSKDHKKYCSSPVIPFDDPTLMFANAGMNQFKDVFTGKKKAEYPRAVTVQKCMRAGGKHNDLENVGRTGRHHTFFEMLGNFSFGDYFKEEAIYYHWEWVTKYLKLPKDKLFATVYLDDDEAFGLWEKIAPELKNGRILRFDKKDNYWTMGETGPNGPCSEIHFDRGEKYGTGPEHWVNGDTERYVEIGNLVFMQYNTRPDGVTEPLPRPSVDTGSGLERITCMMQNADSNYETDAFTGLIEHISEITGKKYHSDERGVSHRVIADHIRALTFCIADGGGLSNEKQGYVLRRILRRASRHGRRLDKHEPFIYRLVPTLVEQMGDVYPEIAEKKTHIEKVIRSEEESFGRTLDTGLELFDNLTAKIKRGGEKTIPGDEVFKLYDTYGFPVDLTSVMAEEQGLAIDMAGFEKMMHQQKTQSRTASHFDYGDEQWFVTLVMDHVDNLPQSDIKTEFVRDAFEINTRALILPQLHKGTPPNIHSYIALVPDKTPFYVESGGQISDFGFIEINNYKYDIKLLLKHNDMIIHICNGELPQFQKADFVKITIDTARRWDIMRNHTATHLLHAALRKVLGDHVKQSGSYVGPDKLRFDFSHFNPMTPDEIKRVEEIVNSKILEGFDVGTVEDDLEKAKESGAMAIFGEKYGSKVRVVSVADFSKELCGGTHVQNVSQIGPFMITLETAVASGIRRIEAVTGREAVAYMLSQKETIDKISKMTNRPLGELSDAVGETQRKLLELQKENKKLKAERFSGGSVSVGSEEEIDGVSFRHHDFGRVEAEEMAGWIDSGKEANYPLITVAVGMVNGKRTFMSSASAAAGVHVGNLSRDILKELGGRGGGKPNFAQGSIPEDTGADHIFKIAADKIRETIEKSSG